jgi:hypothetical protein
VAGEKETVTMDHMTCGCCDRPPDRPLPGRHPTHPGERPPRLFVCPDDRIGDIARRLPKSRAVLERLGLNRCCEAHLTLAESALSAGLSTDGVVRALNLALNDAA